MTAAQNYACSSSTVGTELCRGGKSSNEHFTRLCIYTREREREETGLISTRLITVASRLHVYTYIKTPGIVIVMMASRSLVIYTTPLPTVRPAASYEFASSKILCTFSRAAAVRDLFNSVMFLADGFSKIDAQLSAMPKPRSWTAISKFFAPRCIVFYRSRQPKRWMI